MVKIPHAEMGDTSTQLWSKEQGQNKEIRRLEQRTNKYISVKQMVINSNIKETRGSVNVVVQHYPEVAKSKQWGLI